MTLNNSIRVVTYTGNGVTTEWPFAFPADEGTIFLSLFDTSTEVFTEVDGGDFSVAHTEGGGTVTYPLSGPPVSAGVEVIVRRDVPYTQERNLGNQSRFYSEEVEEALDKLTKQTQQLAESISRALLVRLGGDPITALNVPSDGRENRALIFSSDGNKLEAGPTAAEISAANAAATQAIAANGAVQLAKTEIEEALASGMASAISSAAFPGVTANNVQEALEEIQANLDDVGLAALVNGALLSSFDFMTNEPGLYYFTSTTTGTRPTAWTGLDGICFVHKVSSTYGILFGWASGSNVPHVRRYDSSTYQSWQAIGGTLLDADWIAGTETTKAEVSPAQVKQAIQANAPLELIGSYTHSGGEIVITGLSDYVELLVLGKDLTVATGSARGLQLSSDGGSSWINAYVRPDAGVDETAIGHYDASASARPSFWRLQGFNTDWPLKVLQTGHDTKSWLHVVDANEMNAIRVISTSSSGVPTGSITGGTLYVYGRKSA